MEKANAGDKVSTELSQPPERATIHSPPSAGQTVFHQDKEYTTVKEGLAYILIPPNTRKTLDTKAHQAKKFAGKAEEGKAQNVFYNEIMQYNRDLSVLAIRAFGEDTLVRAKEAQKKKGRWKGSRERKKERKNQESRKFEGEGEERAHKEGPKKDIGADGVAQEVENGTKRPRDEDEKDVESGIGPAKRVKLGGVNSEPQNVDATEVLDEDFIECERSMSRGGSFMNKNLTGEPIVQFRILDALSATGLRALRYAHELPFVTSVTANDLSPGATKSIAVNVEHNVLASKINAVTGNAIAHMYQFVGQEVGGGPGSKYDVIDLDPYGTAVPFLDAAVQAVKDGGLLCVTCTDTAVFMSTGYPEKAYALYGGTPLKSLASHEGGLRLLLHSIATTAARYGIAMEPLLSLSIDYYARVWVRLKRSPAEVKFLAGKTMLVYNCDNGCHAVTPQWVGRNTLTEGVKGNTFWKHSFAQVADVSQNCRHCGFKTHLNGPMWGGPLHNPVFIERILSYLPTLDKSTYGTVDRIEGMLTTALEELTLFPADQLLSDPATRSSDATNSNPAGDPHPFYVFPNSLAKTLHCMAPSENQIKGALRHAGFKAVRTHAARGGIKTDASFDVIWHIMREWIRQKAPIREGALNEGQAGWRILHAKDKTVNEHETEKSASNREEAAGEAVHDAKDASENTAPGTKGNEGTSGAFPFEVFFDEELGKDYGKKLKRFQLNPRANWGPMVKAR
ncbi:TRM-domain-containing protein [Rhizodiscina lignyota]|uniref:tRNA (guanine(26)-N(2))-dimethyltransferase n=1 Tax=Rhizodiscina lignyota TaxID=1504668 RepID=A0A9P4M523_9PEZI|nr:TRM-domain-containing protein [Rhizodiscina lignyota]